MTVTQHSSIGVGNHLLSKHESLAFEIKYFSVSGLTVPRYTNTAPCSLMKEMFFRSICVNKMAFAFN